jgi:GNAT superfamily N-acetyltransferase
MTEITASDTVVDATAPTTASPAPATQASAASEVRIALRADEPELLRLLRLMHAEGGLVDLDEDRAREMFARAFNRQGAVIAVIGTGAIEAAICLNISSFWYSKNSHLEEIFAFVDPNHRRSRHASALIEFAKRCAKETGLALLIGVLSNKRGATKAELYRRKLGESLGQFFLFNHHWNAAAKPRVRVRARTAPVQANGAQL